MAQVKTRQRATPQRFSPLVAALQEGLKACKAAPAPKTRASGLRGAIAKSAKSVKSPTKGRAASSKSSHKADDSHRASGPIFRKGGSQQRVNRCMQREGTRERQRKSACA